jgi:hypothetical protein
MTLVICDMSASLDGYVTGPNDSRENLFGESALRRHALARGGLGRLFSGPAENGVTAVAALLQLGRRPVRCSSRPRLRGPGRA